MHELSVRGLAVSRGDRVIFRGLEFRVASGELLHLHGANGAGKTTLLETLCGLRVPGEGCIDSAPAAAERHWLGHRNGLNPALSPLANLRFWCALNGAPADGATQALARMELRAQRHRPCGELSTGQRRRVALARLLVAPRPWWFLDEPLAGLDAAGIELTSRLLDEHLHAGGAAVVSSHQPLPGAARVMRRLELGA